MRTVNHSLRGSVLEFIKEQCIHHKGIVSLSLIDITTAIGMRVNQTAMVNRELKSLDKSGNIKIHKGSGSSPSRYEFVHGNIIKGVNIELKKEQEEALRDLMIAVADSQSSVFEYCENVTRKMIELEVQVEYYKNIIRNLSPDYTIDKYPMRFVNEDSSTDLLCIIKSLQNKKK